MQCVDLYNNQYPPMYHVESCSALWEILLSCRALFPKPLPHQPLLPPSPVTMTMMMMMMMMIVIKASVDKSQIDDDVGNEVGNFDDDDDDCIDVEQQI